MQDSKEAGESRQTPARENWLHNSCTEQVSRDQQPSRSKRLVQHFNEHRVPVPTEEEEQIGTAYFCTPSLVACYLIVSWGHSSALLAAWKVDRQRQVE